MVINGRMPPIDAWQVERMRVTAFPGEAMAAERFSSWWDEIVGFPAEEVQSRPKMGLYQAQGDFEGRRLVLQVLPGRIEWFVAAIMKASDEEFGAPPIGPFPEVVASLAKVVDPWLPKAPPLQRLAFGAILLQPVESRHAGYDRLDDYLHDVEIDPEGSSDLLYQINRPRESTTIGQLSLNRLTKWSVQIARRVFLTMGSDGVETRTLGEESACRLELDINTPADFAESLPADRLTALLEEMIGLGREIAESGDVR
jgi:hypothetical protein